MSGFNKPLFNNGFSNSPALLRYGVPVLLTVLVTIVKIHAQDVIGYKTPFLLYYVTVIISARYFGKAPAILVTLLASIAADYFFVYPYQNFHLNGASFLQIFIFILECLLIISLNTALKKAVTIISENDIRFKALVEKSAEGIIMMDVHGTTTYCSPSIQNILGYTDQEFIKLPSWALLHQDEHLQVKEQFFRFAAHPDKTTSLLHQMKHKNGDWIWIESRMSNLLDEPPINSIIANFSDVTERVMNEKLREDFVKIASHELKTPLTSLKAYIQILQSRFKSGTDEASLGITNKIEQQVNRVIQMVTNLVDSTTLQNDRITLTMLNFDLNSMITGIIDSIKQTIQPRQIKADLVPLKLISVDREHISQVITKLILNALKYSPAGTPVEVNSQIGHGMVIVSIQDQGIGISKKDCKKIFEKFNGDQGNKKMFQGSGIGLYICSKIITQHGGQIGVESEEGKGSTFWFSLPLNDFANVALSQT